MCSSGERVSLLCVDKHPTQPHLLAAGGQDGVLSIWDMRQELYPVTLLEAHAAESECIKYFSRLFRASLTDPTLAETLLNMFCLKHVYPT